LVASRATMLHLDGTWLLVGAHPGQEICFRNWSNWLVGQPH